MKTALKRASIILVSALMLFALIPISFAAGSPIDIGNVEFEEYFDLNGQEDERMVSVTVNYSVPENTEHVSLLLLGKDTSSANELETKTIYIDQIDDPTGRYEFVIEKSRVSSALGVENIEGETLYLKMGASGVDTPDMKEITYITPSPLTFDGASIRTSGTQGLRYTFSIPKDLYDKLEKPESYEDSDLGFGSVVMPRRYLGDETLEKGTVTTVGGKEYAAKTVPAVNIFKETDTHVWFTVVITEIAEKNYTEEYVAVPYITYLDSETETTVYGAMTEDITVFDIAELAYTDDKETETVKTYIYDNILSVVDPEKYPAK